MTDKKKKQTIILIVVMILLTIFLFFPENDPAPMNDSATSSSEATEQATVPPTEETMSPEEIAKEESINQETTFWMWEGLESGEKSIEYITLRGDGIFILRIELAEHEPYEETGMYRTVNSDGTKLSVPYKQEFQTAEIKGNQLIVAGKTFTQLSEAHF